MSLLCGTNHTLYQTCLVIISLVFAIGLFLQMDIINIDKIATRSLRWSDALHFWRRDNNSGHFHQLHIPSREPPKGGLDREATADQCYFNVVSRGTNLQPGDREVHLTTAVHYHNHPDKGAFNILLNGWARNGTNMDFKCCLISSVSSDRTLTIVQSKAKVYNVYDQWIVDMQNAEFSCSVPYKYIDKSFSKPFLYLTFVETNCSTPPSDVMEIEYPQRMNNSVGICLKISYGDLDPERIIEWFEYVRLLGVTRVFTFLSSDLNPEARDVFLYYNTTGFLEANPIDPAIFKNGTKRGFRRPRYERQAWVDEVMACNDCKHRMSGLDYVIVQDIDEIVVPNAPKGSYFTVLKDTSLRYPNAGAFRFDSHVVALDWKKSRKSPLHLLSQIHRTTFTNYNDPGTDTRWAFMPHRTFYVRNNFAYVRPPYRTARVPERLYVLQHRRRCKSTWKNCLGLTSKYKIKDATILRYESRLIAALKRLPLSQLLPGPKHIKYIDGLNK